MNERTVQEGNFCSSTMQPLKAIDVPSANQEMNETALSSSSKDEFCSSDGAESDNSNNKKSKCELISGLKILTAKWHTFISKIYIFKA